MDEQLLQLLVDVLVRLLDRLRRGAGDDVVVARVFVDADVVERACEPLEERLLVGDRAQHDLVVDALHDVLGQIGLDAPQNFRFVLIPNL